MKLKIEILPKLNCPNCTPKGIYKTLESANTYGVCFFGLSKSLIQKIEWCEECGYNKAYYY